MIGVGTNLLVYAHRADHSWHQSADSAIRELAESGAPWAIPWHCVIEFLAVVTHPRIFDPPTPLETALEQVDIWLESPSLRVLAGRGRSVWPLLRETLSASAVTGPRVHDARVAAECRLLGVTELWTSDRDFGRFPKLRTRNPLVER